VPATNAFIRHASGIAAAKGSRLASQLIFEGLRVRYFTDQVRRCTQLTGLLKDFFTTDFRKAVTV
jgi:hypothetical protein